MSEPVAEHEPKAILDCSATASEGLFNRDVGLTEAMNLTGRFKSQISRDTNARKLPFTLNAEGHKRYQVKDLYQIYGFREPKQQGSKAQPKAVEQPTLPADVTTVELAVLRQQLETLKRENQDLRQDKERLWETTQQLTGRLLAAPPADRQEAGSAPPRTKSLWERITGK